jgi:hypothetical protein
MLLGGEWEMNVRMLDYQWDAINDAAAIAMVFDKVKVILEELKSHISHLIVDDIEIYEEFEEYIFDHMNEIRIVQVGVQSLKQMTDNLLVSLDDYLNRAIPELHRLVNEFYAGPTEDSWNTFVQMIEGVEWIIHVMSLLEANQIIIDQDSILELQLNEKLKLLSVSLEQQDVTLMGDLISYELIPELEQIYGSVKKKVDREVVRNDLN